MLLNLPSPQGTKISSARLETTIKMPRANRFLAILKHNLEAILSKIYWTQCSNFIASCRTKAHWEESQGPIRIFHKSTQQWWISTCSSSWKTWCLITINWIKPIRIICYLKGLLVSNWICLVEETFWWKILSPKLWQVLYRVISINLIRAQLEGSKPISTLEI